MIRPHLWVLVWGLVVMPVLATALEVRGVFSQGGYVVGETQPHATITASNGERTLTTTANADGLFVLGLDRDAASTLTVKTPSGNTTIPITAVEYNIQRINGLPPSQVSPVNPKLLKRIRAEAKLKRQGYASQADVAGFAQTFIPPVTGPVTGAFGNQRVLNGEPKRPHYGVDIAAPKGSPIVAPADGIVSLANNDMHYEGGLVFLDHGQGLVSVYLHMDSVAVKAGQRVKQGEVLGTVGAKGRATGPHLCWRMRWQGQNMDPSLWLDDGFTDPAKTAD